MKRGRKPTIGALVMQHAQFNATVADIVRSTGAKPNTVRVVLQKAASKGTIHISRFYSGRSARTMQVVRHDDSIEDNVNALICSFCGNVKVDG